MPGKFLMPLLNSSKLSPPLPSASILSCVACVCVCECVCVCVCVCVCEREGEKDREKERKREKEHGTCSALEAPQHALCVSYVCVCV